MQTIADTLVIIFKGAGYDARAAPSGEQALELIADWPPDLAILDVILPKINGIDLAILLSVKCPNCRIALTSGHPDTSELLAAATAAGYSFEVIAKPVHPTALLGLASQLDSKQLSS